jgi:hypothetical protein
MKQKKCLSKSTMLSEFFVKGETQLKLKTLKNYQILIILPKILKDQPFQ